MNFSREAPKGNLFTPVARTADCYSGVQLNNGGFKGILLLIDVTVYTSANVTPTIQYRQQTTGDWDEAKAGVAMTSAANFEWLIYPGAATDMGFTTETIGVIPFEWRLLMDYANTDTMTFSVDYEYVW